MRISLSANQQSSDTPGSSRVLGRFLFATPTYFYHTSKEKEVSVQVLSFMYIPFYKILCWIKAGNTGS